jgi:phenylacetic acid degradation operon negative regulatory protein
VELTASSVVPFDDGCGIDLPRPQSGSHPQHLVLTIFGDYWWACDEYLPSAAVVRLLHEFGISNASARAALSRLGRRGLIVANRQGRNTAYRLTQPADELLTDGVQRLLTFADEDAPWDGQWTCVAFSVPESEKATRPLLRNRLRVLGCAPLFDGMWVSPQQDASRLVSVLHELDVTSATVLSGCRFEPKSGVNPVTAWDLDTLRGLYRRFVQQFVPLRDRVRAGNVNASKALKERTAIMDHWRNVSVFDPGLPQELLPSDWPRAEARRLFVEVYDSLGELAVMRIRQILGEFSPDLAALASYHTSEYFGVRLPPVRLARRA